MKTVFSKIYLDTAPIIYFLENNSKYAQKVQSIILDNAVFGCNFVTSVATNIEYLPKPMSEGKQDLIYAFNTLKKVLNIEFIELTEQISMVAVDLRTKYKGLKALDSIHLASAIATGCDAFFTNDKQLKQIEELDVLYLTEL